MKKRLLSMLMAVLMIVSLVPAVALADNATAVDPTKTVIDITKDAAAKQPGIKAVINKADGKVISCEITAFAKYKDQCEVCKTPVTVEVQKASCDEAGLTVTYCSTCGKAIKGIAPKGVAATGHDWTFKVVTEPTCTNPGWGYAQCKVCGTPSYVGNSGEAIELLNRGAKDYAKTVETLKALYDPKGHADADHAVAITADVKDENGRVILKAAKEATHVATIGLDTEKGLQANYGTVVWLDKDGNIVKATTAGAKQADGSGYTADFVCPYCDVKTEGHIVVPSKTETGLFTAHWSSMTVIKKGYEPGIDEDKEAYDGVTDVVYCAACNKTFGGDVISYNEYYGVAIPNVTTKTENAKSATCENKGYTGDVYTWVMTKPATANADAQYGWVLSKVGTEIPALGHHFVAVEGKAPTCEEPGYNYNGYYKCDRVIDKVPCGETKGNDYRIPVAALGHNMTEKVLVEATCQHIGLNVYVCSTCGERMNNNGNYAYYTAKVDHAAADELANVVEATCTEAGYSGDSVCKWCGETLKKGEEVPALGHKTEIKDAKEATCTEAGFTGNEVCTVCGETIKAGEEIPALGHKYENGVCTVCGEKEPVVAPEFKDADSIKDYAKDAVAWAAKEGVVKGDDQGNFNPTADITRQDFVTMLWRLNGETASEKELTFGDKADIKDYAQTAVAWAVENGYITGRDNGNFDPAAKITRAEIVAILNRVADNAKAEKAASFTDIGSHWAKDAIAWAAEAGIVNGVGNDLFAPNDNATRQDTVVMLYKFVNLK